MGMDGDSHFSLSRKSHVRYPTRYPQLRNAEETAEYQQNAGIPLAPQLSRATPQGVVFLLKRRCFAEVLAEPQKRLKVVETGYKVVRRW